MRPNTAEATSERDERGSARGRRTHADASLKKRGAANQTSWSGAEVLPFLPIVRFGAEVVPQFRMQSNSGFMADFVDLWLRMGVVKDEATDESFEQVAERGLQALMEKWWGGMRYFDFKFVAMASVVDALSITLGRDQSRRVFEEEWAEDLARDFMMRPGERHIALALYPPGPTELIDVKPGVEKLNAVMPKLGLATVAALENVMTPWDCLTFSFLEYATQVSQWAHADNEQSFIEDNMLDEEEDFVYEGVTRAELNEHLPPQDGVSDAEIAGIVEQASGLPGWEGEVAATVAELLKQGEPQRAFDCRTLYGELELHNASELNTGMYWGDRGLTERVMDDYFRENMESGDAMYDATGVAVLSLERPEQNMAVLAQWEASATQLRLIDKLLCLLENCPQ